MSRIKHVWVGVNPAVVIRGTQMNVELSTTLLRDSQRKIVVEMTREKALDVGKQLIRAAIYAAHLRVCRDSVCTHSAKEIYGDIVNALRDVEVI